MATNHKSASKTLSYIPFSGGKKKRENTAESDNDSTRKPSETASNGSLTSNAQSIFDPKASRKESEDGGGGGVGALPADVAAVVRLDAQDGVVANLANAVSPQLVSLVRRRCEAHGADMVWPRVRSDGVRAGLPDAGCEVETRLLVRDAVPVQDELRVCQLNDTIVSAAKAGLTPPFRTASSCANLSASYSAIHTKK